MGENRSLEVLSSGKIGLIEWGNIVRLGFYIYIYILIL